MKRLNELLADVETTAIIGSAERDVAGLDYDSRRIGRDYCFFAVPGTASDGHDYIARAVAAGARTVVCQRLPELIDEEVCYIAVSPRIHLDHRTDHQHTGPRGPDAAGQ